MLQTIKWASAPNAISLKTEALLTLSTTAWGAKIRTETLNELVLPDMDGRGRECRHFEITERTPTCMLFGRIDYTDVFRWPCHSTFAYVFRAEHTDNIGASFPKDWS